MTYHTVQLEQLIWWGGPSQLPYLLGKVDQAYSHNNSTVVVGNLFWEKNYPLTTDFVLFLEEIKKRKLPVVMLINSALKNSDIAKKINDFDISIIYVDFFFWRIYQEIIVKQTNTTNLSWNSTAEKFLFLTGKPEKIHRIGLLWKFFKKNLLPHATWSLYTHNQLQTINFLVDLDIGANFKEAEEFVTEYQCIPDNADILFWPDGSTHYGGIPFNKSLYSDVKFRVISETGFHYDADCPWITEKTWLTILNRCPFIIAGDTNSLAYLKALGFKTFENYLEINDYDTIQDSDIRIDAIVTNTESWLKNCNHTSEINQDVEHNYNNFIRLGKEMEADLLDQIKNIGLQVSVDKLISTVDFNANNKRK